MHECLALLAVRVHPVQGPRASSALLGPTTVKAVIESDSAQTVLNSLVCFKLHAILVAVLFFVLPFVQLQDKAEFTGQFIHGAQAPDRPIALTFEQMPEADATDTE